MRLDPPKLASLYRTLERVPREDLQWIVENHLDYLDDKIHEIDILTDYLANVMEVEDARNEFIQFVLDWTKKESPQLDEYAASYARRFHQVRTEVDAQCDRILYDKSIWRTREEVQAFWREFAYINEVDSLHGMFLTSGRWHVNVMLPTIKELILGWLPEQVSREDRNTWAYQMARRIITPEYADSKATYDPQLERDFVSVLVPILQHFDRKLLFLFGVFNDLDIPVFANLSDFVNDVGENQGRYSTLLDIGVYPPFAWHELRASRKPRRPAPNFKDAVRPLMSVVGPSSQDRVTMALDKLSLFKDYELNYNNYNYKGRFNLVSKFFYLQTLDHISQESQESFLGAILGDRFFEALIIVEESAEA